MASSKEIIVTIPGGRRVEAQIGRHIIHTDQPTSNGGDDSAPTPFDTFLASIGTCAGIFIQGFCAKREISTDGITITERPEFADDGALTSVDLEVQLPADFPEKYRDAVLKVAEQCSVKRAIAAQPVFRVHAASVRASPLEAEAHY